MKNAVKAFAILALVTVSVIAGRSFNNANDAALNTPTISNYLRQGFTIDSVTPNQYRYIAEPTGTYAWGEVVVRLHGRTGGPMSLETTYATVTCVIEAKQQGNTEKYNTKSMDVYETIVY